MRQSGRPARHYADRLLAGPLVAALALGIAPGMTAAQPEPRFLADFGTGRFEGEYGTDETTTIDVASFRLRWYLPRGEVQVTAPYYRLTGVGDVSFVGGSPTPGFRGQLPPGVDPPGGPPGGPPGDDDSGDSTVLEQRTVSGQGDLVLQGETYLFESAASGSLVTGLARVKLPTANEDEGLGTGKADYEVGVGLAHPVGRASLLADASHIWVGQPEWIELENAVRLGAGVAVRVGRQTGNNVYTYVENRTSPVPEVEDQRSLAVGGNARLGQRRTFRLAAAVFTGLSDSVEDFGVFVRFGRAF